MVEILIILAITGWLTASVALWFAYHFHKESDQWFRKWHEVSDKYLDLGARLDEHRNFKTE